MPFRDEPSMTVFVQLVSKEFFGTESDENSGDWRKVHSGKFNYIYLSPKNFRVLKSWRKGRAEHVASMGWNRDLFRVLDWKTERKIALGRTRNIWGYHTKMDHQVVVMEV
jgi:hypothetical protein